MRRSHISVPGCEDEPNYALEQTAEDARGRARGCVSVSYADLTIFRSANESNSSAREPGQTMVVLGRGPTP